MRRGISERGQRHEVALGRLAISPVTLFSGIPSSTVPSTIANGESPPSYCLAMATRRRSSGSM